jgi:hypothetical protein
VKPFKLPKIGKRGWLGVVLFAIGLMTFIGARSQAETESEQSSYEDGVNVSGYQDGVAQAAGYGSFADALTNQNRNSGILFMCIGGGLVAWGMKKYGNKKSDSEKPQGNQTNKPSV